MKTPASLLIFSLLLLMLFEPSTVNAAGAGHVRVVSFSVSYRFDGDTGYTRTEDIVRQALDAEGVNAIGQVYLRDSSDKPSAELLEAETILASGETVAVPKASIQYQNGVLNQTYSSSDQKLTRITFPKLTPGAATHYRVKTVFPKPLGKNFAFEHVFSEALLWDRVEITLDVPARLAFRFDQVGVKLVSDLTESGRRKLTWRWNSSATRIAPVGEVNAWKLTPHLVVSSYSAWKQIAEAYGRRVEAKAVVSPEVRKLADEITAGSVDRREQVKRLYEWVRDNIRYTALWSGDGSWVPHDVGIILKNRWGDCKDYATLLQSLLKAKGIEAKQALIKADFDTYELPVLPIFSHFNHVINYVPELNLYLDPTATKVPFGLLPEIDQGKPVLLSRDYSPSSRTPFDGDNLARVVRHSVIELHADGSAEIRLEITGLGSGAIAAREFIDKIGRNQLNEWAAHEVSVSGHEGSASLSLSSSSDPHAFAFTLNEQVRDYLKQPDAAALQFSHPLEGPIAVGRILSRFHDANRERDFACRPFSIEDKFEFRLPPSMKILYLPRDVSIDEAGLHARIHYASEGRLVRAFRSVHFESQGFACSASRYLVLQPVMQRLDKAMNASFLVAQGDAKVLVRQTGGRRPAKLVQGRNRG